MPGTIGYRKEPEGAGTEGADGRSAVRRAYMVARLVTGSVELAERAVTAAIEGWDPETGWSELLQLAVRKATELRDLVSDRVRRGFDPMAKHCLLWG